ncbi:ankyrin repeat domain-containing protein [Herbiconiux ginsengi]|uniref:ankyrin repeat domain-containing protein n=1 Tax=Herbiconiux ginsengi TaxID=381665 RepID=UPI003898DEE2
MSLAVAIRTQPNRSAKESEPQLGDEALSDRANRSPVCYAALDNDIALVASSIVDEADVNVADRAGFRPLHFAAQEYSVGATSILLDHGADPNAQNVHGNTPLFTAVISARKGGEIVMLLLEQGSDPTTPNTTGVSFARSGQTDCDN